MDKLYEFFVSIGTLEVPPDFGKAILGFVIVDFCISVIVGTVLALIRTARNENLRGDDDD